MKRFLLFWFMLLALSFGFLNLSFNHGTLSLEPGTCACLYAAVPNAVNYQGRYREYGQPVTGPRTMHFYIYNTATGLGNGSGANGSLWDMGFGDNTSNNPQVWVSSGIFNVVLTPNVDLRNQPLYLEMQVIPAGSNSYKTFAPGTSSPQTGMRFMQ